MFKGVELILKSGRKLLLIVGMIVIVLVSFYWTFGFNPFVIRSVTTPDTGTVRFSIDPMFIVGLSAGLFFCLGYELFVRGKPSEMLHIWGLETPRQLAVKFALCILLGVVGLWLIYNEFGKAYIWSFYLPDYVGISQGSFALKIASIIALFLLANLLIVFEIRIGSRKKEG